MSPDVPRARDARPHLYDASDRLTGYETSYEIRRGYADEPPTARRDGDTAPRAPEWLGRRTER